MLKYHEVLSTLVENGVDINSANVDGRTSLQMAIACELVDTVELLLQLGATVNEHELSALELIGNVNVIDMIIDAADEQAQVQKLISDTFESAAFDWRHKLTPREQ